MDLYTQLRASLQSTPHLQLETWGGAFSFFCFKEVLPEMSENESDGDARLASGAG